MRITARKIAFVLTIFYSLSLGCKKNNSPMSTPAIITSGTWSVSYYHVSTLDHTSNFTGYVFSFSSGGTISTTVSGVTTNGTWRNDDSKNEFHMTIGAASPLIDLAKGWIIISKSGTEFNLKDDNPAQNEELHFTKN